MNSFDIFRISEREVVWHAVCVGVAVCGVQTKNTSQRSAPYFTLKTTNKMFIDLSDRLLVCGLLSGAQGIKVYRVVLERLAVPHLVKKLPQFDGNSFIDTLTSSLYWSLSAAGSCILNLHATWQNYLINVKLAVSTDMQAAVLGSDADLKICVINKNSSLEAHQLKKE
jgi:hypothetical protein